MKLKQTNKQINWFTKAITQNAPKRKKNTTWYLHKPSSHTSKI